MGGFVILWPTLHITKYVMCSLKDTVKTLEANFIQKYLLIKSSLGQDD